MGPHDEGSPEAGGGLRVEKSTATRTKRIGGRPPPAGRAVVIVRVREPDYVPEGMTPRSHITPHIFIAELSAEQREALENDAGVVSYRDLPQRLRAVKSRSTEG